MRVINISRSLKVPHGNVLDWDHFFVVHQIWDIATYHNYGSWEMVLYSSQMSKRPTSRKRGCWNRKFFFAFGRLKSFCSFRSHKIIIISNRIPFTTWLWMQWHPVRCNCQCKIHEPRHFIMTGFHFPTFERHSKFPSNSRISFYYLAFESLSTYIQAWSRK